jgi:excisionase family DNA binding protein
MSRILLRMQEGATVTVPAWLTIEEGAARARVHVATLRREIRAGRLRHARVGGRKCIRLRPEWVDAWLGESTTPVEAR